MDPYHPDPHPLAPEVPPSLPILLLHRSHQGRLMATRFAMYRSITREQAVQVVTRSASSARRQVDSTPSSRPPVPSQHPSPTHPSHSLRAITQPSQSRIRGQPSIT